MSLSTKPCARMFCFSYALSNALSNALSLSLVVAMGLSSGCSTPKPAAKAKPDAEEFLDDDAAASSAEAPLARPSAKPVAKPGRKMGLPAKAAKATPAIAAASVAPAAPSPGRVAGAAVAASSQLIPPPATPVAPTLSKAAQSCRDMLNHFSPAYRQLFTMLPPGSYVKTNSTLEQLSFADLAKCDDAASRKPMVQAALDAVNTQSGRIGLILPLTGPYGKQATYVVNGLRAAFAESGASFDQLVVLKDSGGLASGVAARLAELVFKDRVAMVIGGFERDAAVTLVQWSERLLLPVVILHRERELVNPSKYAFSVYPDEERLASALALATTQRSFKRIALLKPDSGRADKVTAYFKAAVLANGGQIAAELAYTSNNFESMQAAVRALLHTEMRGREQEYRQAYKEAKTAAEAEGVAFNAKMVVLKPIVDIDAVFIPDDFRSLRYFAKIFKFNQVNKLPLIGNHEWRSPALLDPYDEFLVGSIFGDFVGNYNKLPSAISAPTLASSPYFIEPQMVQVVDFQLIGYRAGRIGKALAQQPSLNRRAVLRAMAQLTGDQAGLPTSGQIFDKDRHCYWPTYVFSIAPHELRLEHALANGAASAASAMRTASGASTTAGFKR